MNLSDGEIIADPDPEPDFLTPRICESCGLPILVAWYKNQVRHDHCARRRAGRKDQRQRSTTDRHVTRTPNNRPFIAIDGEGGGVDALGRQHYLRMCAGDANGNKWILFDDNRPLSTTACLDFLLGLPKNAILVGFCFDYDTTMILRDLDCAEHRWKIERLLANRDHHSWTYWKSYGLQYVPTQFLMVTRLHENPIGGKPLTVPVECRTIDDARGTFQEPFIKIVEKWDVATKDELEMLRQFKAERKHFTSITREIAEYNELECRLFATLMTKHREVCNHPDLPVKVSPERYRGAGYYGASMLKSAKFPKRKEHATISPAMENGILEAFFAGRTEISRTGYIGREVHFYDCNSAYPDKYRHLPCPVHTRWKAVKKPAPGSLYLADLSFVHPTDNIWCAFPFRTGEGEKKGFIHYPIEGSGTYWSPEIEAAPLLGAKTKIHRAWQAEQCCDCRWFDWVEPVYDYRVQQGDTAKGYPIKLGLAAINGKFMQGVGAAPWLNLILSGLTMSMTRAELVKAIASAANPMDVVMTATDGIYSTAELPALEIGTKLGQWKLKQLPDMFIVQPGFYWSPGELVKTYKTRGISRSIVAEHDHEFIGRWLPFLQHYKPFDEYIPSGAAPRVSIPHNVFIGLKLGQELKKTMKDKAPPAGSWHEIDWHQSFDWSVQRDDLGIRVDEAIRHFPIKGDVTKRSAPFDRKLHDQLSRTALMLQAMPDHVRVVE
jgi:hypothetical protein